MITGNFGFEPQVLLSVGDGVVGTISGGVWRQMSYVRLLEDNHTLFHVCLPHPDTFLLDHNVLLRSICHRM